MAKIILDILLILFFIAVGCLQVYVIFRIKELKESYNGFMNSQQEFVRAIEKARQSLMIVNSQATDVLPELKKCIKESDNLMQDFSFVLARANKKIDVLQDLSSISTEEKQAVKEPAEPVTPISNYKMAPMPTVQETPAVREEVDPVLARLEKLEEQERLEQAANSNEDFLKTDNKRTQQQQDLIEKALKEIL
tara:strand:+ start:3209 stop:3787 length:579 start_codon:yes stop_codon:yes gene_type:complete